MEFDGWLVSAADVGRLAAEMAAAELRELIVVIDGEARIPPMTRALVMSPYGVLRVTPATKSLPWEHSAPPPDGAETTCAAVWGRSVITVGPSIEYLGCGTPFERHRKTFPTTIRWRRLAEAHTPFYDGSELWTVMIDQWTARSAMVGARLPSRRFVVMVVSSEGYRCVRCGSAFATEKEWRDHYGPTVAIPSRIMWQQIGFNAGTLALTTLHKLPTPAAFAFRELPPLTTRSLMSPRTHRAFVARGAALPDTRPAKIARTLY